MKKYIGIAIVILTLSATNVWAATDFVPGLEFLQLPANAKIEDILRALYIWGIGFVALAAFFMFTYGGVLYLIAGDKDPSSAKSYMKNALYGLLLALGSYLILNTINPQLVSIKNLDLPPINSTNNQSTDPGTVAQNDPCKAVFGAPASERCRPSLECSGPVRQPLSGECWAPLTGTDGVCEPVNRTKCQ